jgi:hypothetical protein
MNVDRRSFLKGTLPSVVCLPRLVVAADSPPTKPKNVVGEIGLTTGSFMRHLSVKTTKGKLRLLDLPQIMRDELDMRVIDLMTRTLASFKPDYIDDLREQAEKAGCIITNLEMNQRGLDMASPDAATRKKALDEYKRTIDVAARLGCRWVRPSPTAKKPDLKRLAVAYRELIDYSAPKGITLLVVTAGAVVGPIFPTLIAILLGHVEPSLHGRAVGIFFCIGGIGWTAIPILIGMYAKRTSVQRAFLFATGSAVLLLALSVLLAVRL